MSETYDYDEQGPDPARRRSRATRAGITILVVLLLLFFAFWYAFSYYRASEARGTSTATATCTPYDPKAVVPANTVVNVYNASTRNGLAASTAKALKDAGFQIGEVGNEKGGRQVKGVAEIRYGVNTGKHLALLQGRLKQGSSVKGVNDKRKAIVLDLVLGQKFAGLTAPPTPAAGETPMCSPPKSSP